MRSTRKEKEIKKKVSGFFQSHTFSPSFPDEARYLFAAGGFAKHPWSAAGAHEIGFGLEVNVGSLW